MLEGLVDGRKHLRVGAFLRRRYALDATIGSEPDVDLVGVEALANDGADVIVQQPAPQQLADQEAHAAGGMEVVHIGKAVRIDARE
ncbi:hypothetical protein D9M70_602700 [compost metagenome]